MRRAWGRSEFISDVTIPPTCGPGCSRETCARLRQSQDDVEMLLAKRTQQDAEIVRLRALVAHRADAPTCGARIGLHSDVYCDIPVPCREHASDRRAES